MIDRFFHQGESPPGALPIHPPIAEIDPAEVIEFAADGLDEIVPVTDRPHVICLPIHYEPNYPYPLIVWFHGARGNERELETVFAELSERNYLGLALRGNVADEPAGTSDWSLAEQRHLDVLADVYYAVCEMRRNYHIHSERIFLAGSGSGGAMALRLLLQRPEWFGGAINLGGPLPEPPLPLSRFRELPGTRVLLTTNSGSRTSPVREMVEAGRLLHSAGISVATRVYRNGPHLSPKRLRDVDRWLMDGICQTVPV